MPKILQKGVAHLIIIILVLIGAVIVISVGTFITRQVRVDSVDDVTKILGKKCPTEEELVAAETYITEFGPEELKDDIEEKKKEPPCTVGIIQRIRDTVISRRVSPTPTPFECITRYSWKCGQISQGSDIYRSTICYDILNGANGAPIKEEVCDTTTGDYTICVSHDETYDDRDCEKYWDNWPDESLEEYQNRTGDEIPVGFPDQYDFGPYQDPDVVPPEPDLEPLDANDAPEPELEPLTP